jgi:putative redox protein
LQWYNDCIFDKEYGKKIASFKVNAKGSRRNQPPIKFGRISLEFLLISEDALDADIQKAIELTETSYCPVWQMLKNNAEIIPKCKVSVS